MRQTSSRPPLFYGWLLVGVTFFMSLATVGARNGFGVFIKPMEQEFNWSRSTTSWAASIGFLVNGLSQPFLGRLYDRFGSRVIVICLVVVGLSTALLAATQHIVFLVLIFGLVMSVGLSGSSLTNTGALLTKWFRRKRGTALSFSTAGASVGGLVLVPFTAYLIEATGEWRYAWLALGGIVLFLALPLAHFFLRDDPKQMGLLPDGDEEPPESSGSPQPPSRGPLEVDDWRDSFRSLPIYQMSGAYFVCGFTTAIMSVHFVPYAQDRGLSPSTAALAFGLMMGLNSIGVIAAGVLSDKFGRKNLLALVYTGRGCAYAILLLAPGMWGLWGFASIAGFAWLATAPLTTSLTADVYGVRTVATLAGVSFVLHQIGGFTSIQFAAYMYDIDESYTRAFAVAGLLLIPAAIAAFSIQEKKYSIKYQSAPAVSGSFGN